MDSLPPSLFCCFLKTHPLVIFALFFVFCPVCFSTCSWFLPPKLLTFVALAASTCSLFILSKSKKLPSSSATTARPPQGGGAQDEKLTKVEDAAAFEPTSSKEVRGENTGSVRRPWGADDLQVGTTSCSGRSTPRREIIVPREEMERAGRAWGSEGALSDDDEESLIEIALPDGHPLSPRGGTGRVIRPSFCGFSAPELLLFGKKSAGLAELLSDVGEEDNLIEIDIAAGSIKCPRLQEIKA